MRALILVVCALILRISCPMAQNFGGLHENGLIIQKVWNTTTDRYVDEAYKIVNLAIKRRSTDGEYSLALENIAPLLAMIKTLTDKLFSATLFRFPISGG